MDASPTQHMRIVLLVFALALAVRVIYLIDSADNPTFTSPIVDSYIYHDLARTLVNEGRFQEDRFFWQACFYPFYLAAVYAVTGGSMVAAKAVQIVVGAAACALTCHLGRRTFGARAGLAAGLIAVFYGPAIFYDGELLATGWAVFWTVALLTLFLEARDRRKLLVWAALGVVGMLAVLTRPPFLPFLLAAFLWLAATSARSLAGRRFLPKGLGAAAIGCVVVALPVALTKYRVTGRFGVLADNGAVNLYLGNNPDRCSTVTARPGWRYARLVHMPDREGIHDERAKQRYFYALVWDYMRTQPGDFARGMLVKSAEFFSTREIPNTVSIYLARDWSAVLRVLVWKVGRFGFPFGVVLPLAVIGLIAGWRRVPIPLWLLLVLYPMVIIAVHVNDRYRMPWIPAAWLLAGAGVSMLVDWARARAWPRVVGACVFAVLIAALTSVAAPFCLEGLPYRAIMYYRLGGNCLREQHDLEAALAYYKRTLALDPTFLDAHLNIARVLEARGEPDAAIAHLRTAAALRPDESLVYVNLSGALLNADRFAEALDASERAAALDPADPAAQANRAMALGELGRYDEAVAAGERACWLATEQGDDKLAALIADRLAAYRAGRSALPPPPTSQSSR
jgi:4-amino-4-deoxy-L-arabinose transferase-like glycosyltransferase